MSIYTDRQKIWITRMFLLASRSCCKKMLASKKKHVLLFLLRIKLSHSGVKSAKKRNLGKLNYENKSISRIFFKAKFHFLQFQKWPKINFWTGKKLPKMQFHEKKYWFIWFHELFSLDFFKFSGSLRNLTSYLKKLNSNMFASLLNFSCIWCTNSSEIVLHPISLTSFVDDSAFFWCFFYK